MKEDLTLFNNRMMDEYERPLYPIQCKFECYNPDDGEPSKNKDADYRVHIYFKKESDKDKYDDIRDIAHPYFKYLLGNSSENEFAPETQNTIDESKQLYLLALDTAQKARKWLKFIGMVEIK